MKIYKSYREETKMDRRKVWKMLWIALRVVAIIYLVVSSIYIAKHITFQKAPDIVAMGFNDAENRMRVFMGLPPTYNSWDRVGPIYILSVVIRVAIALLLLFSLFRKKVEKADKSIIWHDRKRNLLGLPWSFTQYSISEDRLFVATGFFNKTYNEVRLYRVRDTSLTRSLWQRIIGTGTIHLITSDLTLKNFDLKNILDAESINEMISRMTDEARKKNRVIAREDMKVDENEPEQDIEDSQFGNDNDNDTDEDSKE